MTAPGLPAVLAGLLVVAVLMKFRIRPDHRVRRADRDGAAAAAGRDRPPRRSRRRAPGPADFAGWCDTLSRDLRSGSTLGFALRSHPAPHGSAFAAVPQRLWRGMPVADAVRIDGASDHEQAIATVLTACAVSGGPAAEPLDRVAATLRRRAADAAERQVQSAQARLSARVMTIIPVAVLGLLLATSPTVRDGIGTPIGFVTIVVGLALNGIGWRWMRRVIGSRP